MPDSSRLVRPPAWVFVALAFAVFSVLVGVSVSGSSISVLYSQENVTLATTDASSEDPALLLGKPRPIRSDEWSIATPTAVSQTIQGFPDDPWIGLTRTDPNAFQYSLPTVEPSVIAKPQVWGYLMLGPERGLAWSWWFPFLLAAVSLFLLVNLLVGRPLLAAAVAVIGSFTPFVAWWTAPSPNLLLGYSCLVMYFFARGLKAESWLVRVGWGVLVGWAGAASVLVLYPPWTVSTGLVALGFVIGLIIDLRPGLLRIAQIVGGALVASVVLLIPWYLSVAPAFEAINATIYPGQRRSPSGGGLWQTLLSAPANLVASTTGSGPSILNQSEVASTWLPLALLACLVPLFLVRGATSKALPSHLLPIGKGTVSALSLVLALLLVWMFVPALPEILGKVTLLNRVPGNRAPVALGLAVLLIAVGLSRLELKGVSKRVQVALITTASAISAAAVTVASHALYPEMPRSALVITALGGVLMTWAFGSLATGIGRRATLSLATAYALVSFAVVNPVYRGLGPLTSDPVAVYARELASSEERPIAVTLGGFELQALVRGGGLQVLSWTTEYPDSAFWEKALPGGEDVWNNFRNYSWFYDPKAAPVTATVIALDSAELQVDLCDPLIRDLGFSRVFSPKRVEAPCLAQDRVLERGGQKVYVYRTL